MHGNNDVGLSQALTIMCHQICEHDYVYFFDNNGFYGFYVNCIHAITFLSILDITTLIYWMCHIRDKTDFMNYFYLPFWTIYLFELFFYLNYLFEHLFVLFVLFVTIYLLNILFEHLFELFIWTIYLWTIFISIISHIILKWVFEC